MKNILVLAACLFISAGAFAQDFKTMIANELKAANFDNVSQLLGFKIDPASKMGKAYSEISDKLLANSEQRFNMIKKFAENRKNITPEMANSLIKDSVKFQKERTKIMSQIPKAVGKDLSPANLLTLMQYEGKKQAIVDAFLAKNIPFANM
jgi:hypothetical protein